MKKQFINTVALLVCLIPFGQLWAQEQLIEQDKYRKIYIDKNPNSSFRQSINRSPAAANIEENIDYIKNRYGASLDKFVLGNFSKDWIPLQQYQGQYYLYSACDFGGVEYIVSDSCVYFTSQDGYIPTVLKSTKLLSPTHYQFKAWSGYRNPQNKEALDTYDVYLINNLYQISVWKITPTDGEQSYQLMIPRSQASHFDLIVCQSDELADDLEFDTIDYKQLINE